MIRVYAYQKCSRCRKTLKWLEEQGIEYEERAIKEAPPTVGELREVMQACGGEVRRLFNTSGMDCRALGLKDKLPGMSEKDAFALLRSNGMLRQRLANSGFPRAPLDQALNRDQEAWSVKGRATMGSATSPYTVTVMLQGTHQCSRSVCAGEHGGTCFSGVHRTGVPAAG